MLSVIVYGRNDQHGEQEGRSEGDFDSGIERSIRALLVSPEFLFRTEGMLNRLQDHLHQSCRDPVD